MDHELLTEVVLIILWALAVVLVIRRTLRWWRQVSKDKHPVFIVDDHEADELSYAPLAEMIEHERRHERGDRS